MNKINGNSSNKNYTPFKGNRVSSRTENQKQYLKSIINNDITFCYGPAGTGKTLIAVGIAAQLIEEGKYDKIVLTRPIVEAGQRTNGGRSNVGYLPGDIKSKMIKYLKPLYDELGKFISKSGIAQMENDETIEVCPLEMMRGRNFENTIMICDEAQNAVDELIHMFVTRLSDGGKLIMAGDIEQVDLPQIFEKDFINYINNLDNIEGIGIIELVTTDIQRHPLVKSIIERRKERLTHVASKQH